MSNILCSKESGELHLHVKTLLDLYITEVHMITQNADDTEEYQENLPPLLWNLSYVTYCDIAYNQHYS